LLVYFVGLLCWEMNSPFFSLEYHGFPSSPGSPSFIFSGSSQVVTFSSFSEEFPDSFVDPASDPSPPDGSASDSSPSDNSDSDSSGSSQVVTFSSFSEEFPDSFVDSASDSSPPDDSAANAQGAQAPISTPWPALPPVLERLFFSQQKPPPPGSHKRVLSFLQGYHLKPEDSKTVKIFEEVSSIVPDETTSSEYCLFEKKVLERPAPKRRTQPAGSLREALKIRAEGLTVYKHGECLVFHGFYRDIKRKNQIPVYSLVKEVQVRYKLGELLNSIEQHYVQNPPDRKKKCLPDDLGMLLKEDFFSCSERFILQLDSSPPPAPSPGEWNCDLCDESVTIGEKQKHIKSQPHVKEVIRSLTGRVSHRYVPLVKCFCQHNREISNRSVSEKLQKMWKSERLLCLCLSCGMPPISTYVSVRKEIPQVKYSWKDDDCMKTAHTYYIAWMHHIHTPEETHFNFALPNLEGQGPNPSFQALTLFRDGTMLIAQDMDIRKDGSGRYRPTRKTWKTTLFMSEDPNRILERIPEKFSSLFAPLQFYYLEFADTWGPVCAAPYLFNGDKAMKEALLSWLNEHNAGRYQNYTFLPVSTLLRVRKKPVGWDPSRLQPIIDEKGNIMKDENGHEMRAWDENQMRGTLLKELERLSIC